MQRCLVGVVGFIVAVCMDREWRLGYCSRSCLERRTKEGDSPVDDMIGAP